jgi:peroxiredoxin
MKNLKKIIQTLICTLIFVPFCSFAQLSDLKGLKKMTNTEIAEKGQLRFSAENVMFFSPEGEKINMMEAAPYLQNKDYGIDFYMNEAKEIKALVLRNATEEERKSRIEKANSSQNKSNINEIAKPFTLIDINKEQYDLAKLKGKVVVINFWYTNCKPCIMEIPDLNKLTEKYAGKEVVFLGITFDETAQVKSFLAKKDFKYKVIPEADKVVEEYAINSFPTHLIIDQNSKIVFKTVGLDLSNTIKELDKNIENLLH